MSSSSSPPRQDGGQTLSAVPELKEPSSPSQAHSASPPSFLTQLLALLFFWRPPSPPNLSHSSSSSSSSTPQSRWARRRRKVLILDLDETLVHSTSRPSRSDRSGAVVAEHVIEVMVEDHACLYYVAKRPHVDYFLRKVNEWYDVVLFTASMAEYANPVCDWLDPEGHLLPKRYFREHCTLRGIHYTKDLATIEPDLRQVILIDNSAISFALHKENGIPIESWFDTPEDQALLDLLPFLDALRFVEDVRSILSMRIRRR
ncbi:MAG: NLI interacting factor-like phosphatase-domain-containing protein [Piptocephalis tieghemiana]|nr:MAG: NLI interacting factor-like phosphatase-domain-containing protein [Piptocephalis tieghemiana]